MHMAGLAAAVEDEKPKVRQSHGNYFKVGGRITHFN